MQQCKSNKNVVARRIFTLILICAVTAVSAGENPWNPKQPATGQHNTGQSRANYHNPWLLPPEPGKPLEYPQSRQDQRLQNRGGTTQNRDYGDSSQGGTYRRDRFVTPDVLESLKRQQSRYQVMPENYNLRRQPRQQTKSRQPATGIYWTPSYGMGMNNPLYDTPAASPWGNLPDMLYKGESVPLVPREAIGGIYPLDTPLFGSGNLGDSGTSEQFGPDPYGMNPYSRGSDMVDEMYMGAEPYGTDNPDAEYKEPRSSDYFNDRSKGKVFNPFTFLPDSGLK